MARQPLNGILSISEQVFNHLLEGHRRTGGKFRFTPHEVADGLKMESSVIPRCLTLLKEEKMIKHVMENGEPIRIKKDPKKPGRGIPQYETTDALLKKQLKFSSGHAVKCTRDNKGGYQKKTIEWIQGDTFIHEDVGWLDRMQLLFSQAHLEKETVFQVAARLDGLLSDIKHHLELASREIQIKLGQLPPEVLIAELRRRRDQGLISEKHLQGVYPTKKPKQE